MRISTSMIFDTGARNMTKLQGDLFTLQNQMATGRRILTPADDPVAAAQALVVSQQQSINSQFIDNQSNAASQLAALEDRLNGIGDLLQEVKSRVVEAGNGAYSDNDRKTLAADIRERYQELLGLANSADAMGNYVFSGFRGTTQPFSVAGTAGSRTVTYQGDDGKRQLQVEASRIMDVSESGSDLFMRIPQGNGQFFVTAGTAGTPNTGSGVIASSSLAGGYGGQTYQLVFQSASTFQLKIDGVLQVDASSNPINYAYTSGADIALPDPATPASAAVKLALTGVPAAGDSFTLQPSTNQDIFSTLDQMISALESPVAGSATTTAAFQNQLGLISQNLDQAFDKVLGKQTSIGARRSELDALTSVATDLNLQYQTDLSNLQDLDYTKAISEMSNRQMVLQAAQLSFKQVSQLSLFSFLS